MLYIIQKKVINMWGGVEDNPQILYAIECARCNGDLETVDKKWRWLAEDLMGLYDQFQLEAMACNNYIRGWIAGVFTNYKEEQCA